MFQRVGIAGSSLYDSWPIDQYGGWLWFCLLLFLLLIKQRYSLLPFYDELSYNFCWISFFFLDFVLTFERDVHEDKKWDEEELSERQQKREHKRADFLDNLERAGIENEVEQPKEVWYNIS